jgi:LDH2 family malate/lactate/ureidoglycolate dehydrogenase
LPFGGYKGAGLAFMLELLTGALAGGLFSFEIGRLDGRGLDPESTKFFLAINIEAFTDKTRFGERVEEFVAHLRSCESGLEILLPGDRGWNKREIYLKEGIPVHLDILSQLREAGISL